ncbi:histone deacetylase Hda1p [Trichomonascus vanleenenianus]|uniref:histone deacetylase HDA1 n=1 Tax=Trichomonascus vanleenenianus TaxID=2268995 RepID=UPI003EC96B53
MDEIPRPGVLNGDGVKLEDGSLKRKREEPEPVAESVSADLPAELVYANLKTGICYDVRMRYHCRIVTSPMDYVDPHPEDPRRIYRIYKAIAEAGLLRDPDLRGAEELGPLMLKIPVREAAEEEILMVHTRAHLEFIASSVAMTREQLLHETEKGDSIYLSNDSFLCAKLSCGGAIELCKAVVERRVKNGIAVVRPPGHHAEPHVPGGFCLFSNVAVAAKVMLRDYSDSVRRVLVLDWDVHHGNGTQRAFLDDPRVLYMSLHRHEGGRFYPGTPFGGHNVVGDGSGAGFSVNVPWSHAGMGDADYLYAFEKVIMPIAVEYDPDLVIISAGFDAAEGDIMGGMLVTPNGYAQMTHMLKSLANGRLAVVLEGGYNLNAIAKSALAVTKVLLGDPPGMPHTKVPTEHAVRDVEEVVKTHAKYWRALRPAYEAASVPATSLNTTNESLDEMVRAYQSRFYFRKFGMCSLPVIRGSNSFLIGMDAQILASEDIHKKQTVVVVVHDTPEIWADRDAVLGTVDTGDSLVVDPGEKFLDYYAAGKEYGVVDVAIPKAYEEGYNATLCAQETCLFLWDSFIEYFDAKDIIFVGIGQAYHGIVQLAGQRAVRDRVRAVIAFANSPVQLRPLVPVVDETTAEWFYRNSLVFASSDHPAWDPAVNAKKPRRKFGRVIKAENALAIGSLVQTRFEEACEFIDDSLEEEESESSD